MTELLIGAGSNHMKKLCPSNAREWKELITLDFNPDHKPDVLHDLTVLPYPFQDNTFDEIHAYEVLEHTGQQGDFRFFLDQWSEFWRILKPGGFLAGTCPDRNSPWAWGDPGHTRIISEQSFTFLNQPAYQEQVGITPMSDYRWLYKADFNVVHLETQGDTFIFALQAIKPSRIGERHASQEGLVPQDNQQQHPGVSHGQNLRGNGEQVR
jgi:SAM-dependent methyltransferase